MIHRYLRDILEMEIHGLEWTIDNYTGEDDTGTIFYETPSGNEINDERDFIFPSYQVYIRSTDYTKAEFYALRTFELLNKRHDERADITFKDKKGRVLGIRSYMIFFINCEPPIRVGVDKKSMEYSINMSVTIKEIK
ncbi:hypothetical protein [Bacillus cereus]|uniref:hypothetical protein n=1 Tax=Bacillus cereus TaxID=1396 RepID=UPI003D65E34F